MGDIAALELVQIPLAQLHSASWNANRVPKDVVAKIRKSIREFGVVENNVVRTLPQPCPYCKLATAVPHYEILSGNHRTAIYESEGMDAAPCVIRDCDDAKARILAQVLNRTHGADDPDAYRMLLEDVIAELEIEEIVSFLPETEESIKKILADVTTPADASGYGDPQLWGVVIECSDESEQAGLLETLGAQGYTARALML